MFTNFDVAPAPSYNVHHHYQPVNMVIHVVFPLIFPIVKCVEEEKNDTENLYNCTDRR